MRKHSEQSILDRERNALLRLRMAEESRSKLESELSSLRDQNRFNWSLFVPIFVAVIGATASIIATAYSQLQQAQLASAEARNELELQGLVAQQELIKLAVSAEEDRADANIEFLIASNLVPDYAEGLAEAVRQEKTLSTPSTLQTPSDSPSQKTGNLSRVILNWTGGSYVVSQIDRRHYHEIIAADGTRVPGFFPPEANLPPLEAGRYAAHARGANIGSIGLAVAAMMNTQEVPFRTGPYPVTIAQVEGLCNAVVDYSLRYDIPVTRDTVLTHAEVETALGIPQNHKWDITWLPDMEQPGNPVQVGDRLREMVSTALEAPPLPNGLPARCKFQ